MPRASASSRSADCTVLWAAACDTKCLQARTRPHPPEQLGTPGTAASMPLQRHPSRWLPHLRASACSCSCVRSRSAWPWSALWAAARSSAWVAVQAAALSSACVSSSPLPARKASGKVCNAARQHVDATWQADPANLARNGLGELVVCGGQGMPAGSRVAAPAAIPPALTRLGLTSTCTASCASCSLAAAWR